jgi:serralysin
MNSAGDEPLQDPWLGIYDASGNFVSYDDDSGNGVNALINYQSDVEGVIYISAEAYDLDLDFGTYELSVFISDLDAGEVEPVTPRETEPNDEFADLLTPGVAIRGQTASYSDDDWFLLSMDNAGTITVSFDDGAGSSYSDHDVSIVDASGNTLAQKSIYSSDTLTAQVATSGNYFVLVENSSETADYILTADIS